MVRLEHGNIHDSVTWWQCMKLVLQAVGPVLLSGKPKVDDLLSSYNTLYQEQYMENVITLNESWDKTKELLRQKFAMLTDGDVLFVERRRDEMLGRLEAKLGKTREEVRTIIAKLYLNEHSEHRKS